MVSFSYISKLVLGGLFLSFSSFLQVSESRLGEKSILNDDYYGLLENKYRENVNVVNVGNVGFVNKVNNVLQLEQPHCDVLALSGGGSFGAVEIGILDSLVESGKIPYQYDIVTGISAGGLNAGFLSFYNNISNALPLMRSIYGSLQNSDIYERALLKIASEWSIYNTNPLKSTLHKYIDGRVREEGSPITLVGASNILNKSLDVFRYDLMNDDDKVDVLMATSAIPIVFPPHIINGTYYVDGGVISNEMIIEALGVTNCDFYNFVFISASSHEKSTTPITGLFSYISAVLHLIFDTFDYQLSEFADEVCQHPRGVIKACFPNSTELENYSILDFNNGETLYTIGKSNYFCGNINLC